jgi:hypothetical protein
MGRKSRRDQSITKMEKFLEELDSKWEGNIIW